MAETKIEWARYTFNPWVGCMKIAPECKFCYAEAQTDRWHPHQPHWGPDGVRRVTVQSNWNKPLRWNADAVAEGKIERVFCASLADWAEDRADLIAPRARLFQLIEDTRSLLYLLLTKRYQHGLDLIEQYYAGGGKAHNIVIGFTTGTKATTTAAFHALQDACSKYCGLRVQFFLSCEPLLEDITPQLQYYYDLGFVPAHVIVGGESGPKARPTHPDWARNVRDFCLKRGIPFMFKQWGCYTPNYHVSMPRNVFYTVEGGNDGLPARMYKGKKEAAGRTLDGRTHLDLIPIPVLCEKYSS